MTDSMTHENVHADSVTHVTVDAHGVEHAGVHHPSDWEYIKIALWLALFTLIEVGTYFESVHHAPRWSLFVVLSVLMTIKFFMVGAYFMHLKFDTPWFRRLFIAGLSLAVVVYMVFLFAFDLFGLG